MILNRRAMTACALALAFLGAGAGFCAGRLTAPAPAVSATPSPNAAPATGGPAVVEAAGIKTLSGDVAYKCAGSVAGTLFKPDNNATIGKAWVSSNLSEDKKTLHVGWSHTPGLIVDVLYGPPEKLTERVFALITDDSQIPNDMRDLMKPGTANLHVRHVVELQITSTNLLGWDGSSLDFSIRVCE